MLIDQKWDDFLIFAYNDDGARLYAFRYNHKPRIIIVVEDIPANYPSISVYTTRGVKWLVKDLEHRGWTIQINHVILGEQIMKEMLISILPFWWLTMAVFNLIFAGAYAQGYETTHEGVYWFFVSIINGVANIVLALIFLLNL